MLGIWIVIALTLSPPLVLLVFSIIIWPKIQRKTEKQSQEEFERDWDKYMKGH